MNKSSRNWTDEIDGDLLVTGLMRDDTQQMNRIGMLGIGSNDLFVKLLCLLQSPGLMMCDGGFEPGIQRWAGGGRTLR